MINKANTIYVIQYDYDLKEASKGFQYFDTTINKPIFWDGTKWIDATGATV